MKKYAYRDKRKSPPELVFECEADNILEADALYRAAGHGDPAKQPYVGCEAWEQADRKETP